MYTLTYLNLNNGHENLEVQICDKRLVQKCQRKKLIYMISFHLWYMWYRYLPVMWKTRVTRRVPLTVQELFTLTEFTAPGFSVVRVARSVVFCVVFCRSCIAVFILVIVFYVLLRFTAFEYPLWYLQTFLI